MTLSFSIRLRHIRLISMCMAFALSSYTYAQNDKIIINEIMAANVDVYRDPSTNFGPWVELYNPTEESIALGGLYVSDDLNNLKKNQLRKTYGTLPAKGFAILNFDHHDIWTSKSYRQIDDKLNCEGGTIIISDGENILAMQEYPQAIGRVSYARTTDGGSEWGLAGTPTPGKSNTTGSNFAVEQLPKPVADVKGCVFTTPFNIKIEIPEGATLKYTTNGSTPTLTSGSTSADGIFSISASKCYRFRFFQDGKLPSGVSTYTYIKSTNEPFPIIAIAIDPNDFSSSTSYGIFSQGGTYGRPGNGQTGNCNWNMDWDRPVNFEYINTDNECCISQECDFSACGGWSRAWTPHSFKLKATKVYDLQNTFDYQFFDNKPFLKHKTLQIRNGGNDNGCRIKDAAIQQIAARSGIYVDYQSWQPVHVYKNGVSYAVLNMREPNNKHFAYSNYGIDTEEMEQFEISADSGYVQMVGTGEHFKRLCNLAVNAADEKTYSQIRELVDIDEYINYMALELYTGCTDWPQNNVKGFRSNDDGKFHFVLFDMDFALDTSTPLSTFAGKKNYRFNTLYGYDYSQGKSISGTSLYKENPFVTLFLNMLKNEAFKKQFIDTYCLVGGSIYTPTRVRNIVSEMSTYLNTGGYVNSTNTANTIINSFNSARQNNMISHLQSYFGLTTSKRQTVTLSSNVESGKIFVNNIEVPTGTFSGTLYGPITYKATAPAGYTFVGWTGDQSSSGTDTSIFAYGSKWSYADSNISSTNWKSSISAFTKSGNSPIGYGKSGLATTVAASKMTYYAGKEFTLTDTPAPNDRFTLNFTIDDGAIVYINGTEAGRYNMPGGTVTYNTAASSHAQNNPDTSSMELKASLFKKGKNYIAIELHNNSTSSSDAYWNAELIMTIPNVQASDKISEEEEFTIEGSGTYNLCACFEPIEDDELCDKGTTPIKINEVSASNSVSVNEYFKKDDWIELYNTTSEPIDIAGMYISDKTDKPRKYQIPHGVVNTVIQPYGHLVLWASKRDALTQLHLPFKLENNDAAAVIITSEDGSWSDCLTYNSHTGNQSVGLYPDGSNNVYLMDVPSTQKSNFIDSYSNFIAYYTPGTIPDNTGIEDTTHDDNTDIVSEQYYTLGGIAIAATHNNLRAGTYIVKKTLSDGRIVTGKVLVR